MSTPQTTAALTTGEPDSAAGNIVREAVAALAAEGEHVKAAGLWRQHLVDLARRVRALPTLAEVTAPFAWDTKVKRLGAVAALDDLIDAWGDAL